ncbi:hypothetical protein Q5424_11290 [Conexibacter sp. JD483]|uniref:hypothetical protein n=1 Tax=unclassified Conexibacter TaxID=2627773 RepID=UPI0027284B76|nr:MULTISPECIES: hypothetical protein [unclassified Conexibacter]MDO8187920.1 hypothetical protein [Conexibacter sp. CPCC 205706]MDO8198629.1 hypothetical protein [Conexibacter sp. CPCC 205762]MDR9369669.1 hypothetical protein [Conexibacter sp. JD483]
MDRELELELWDAWVFAAGDATRALRAWEQAGGDDLAPSYFAYQAALDREQQAASVLAEIAAERRLTARRLDRALAAAV